MKKQPYRLPYLLAFLTLALSYLLCRYVAFHVGMHGMKDWPMILAIAGCIVILLAALYKSKWTAYGTALGYPLAFLLAYLFQSDGLDHGGGRETNLWLLWMIIFLLSMIMGFAADLYLKTKVNRAQKQDGNLQ